MWTPWKDVSGPLLTPSFSTHSGVLLVWAVMWCAVGLLCVVQVWLQHTSDPLIAPDAQEVIGALASHSSCLPSLVQAAAPTLAAILQRGAATRLAKQQGQPPAAAAAAAAAAAGAVGLPDESPMLVEASLDLLGALVKPGQDATTLEVSWVLAAFQP